MQKIVIIIIGLFVSTIYAQEEKQMWAKSYLNKEAPVLVVEKWLSDEPDVTNKFVLIDFWATWCGPCKKAIPNLNDFQQEFKEDLVVIGISDEPKSTVKKLKKPVISYYSAIDTKKTLFNLYQIEGLPHCVIIDPNGIVRWEGFPDLEDFELTSKVIEDIIKTYKPE
ncbi:TlpA disulfide reductase family protein [uncultured Algibacter sp.]|uniref:TlpA family protein disulfide reductase n=1 Tax=uncultured Algibacter sp. TaxID=298659 RepID=UPI00321704C8